MSKFRVPESVVVIEELSMNREFGCFPSLAESQVHAEQHEIAWRKQDQQASGFQDQSRPLLEPVVAVFVEEVFYT